MLDTNVLLWRARQDERLGKRAIQAMDEAVDRNAAGVSAISLWEIATLIRRRRIALDQPLREWSRIAFGSPGLRLLPVDEAIAIDAGELQGIRGDPGDRIIIATARRLGCPLMTADQAILGYAAAGGLQAIDARG
ncbi:MAG TPA: type II toxin-antitoxin system VapC family toxin [Allosphingosinicella sp.]|nr:type II toxin-antitoxin system VapC family toxin [Allosphingosinicella sp.]